MTHPVSPTPAPHCNTWMPPNVTIPAVCSGDSSLSSGLRTVHPSPPDALHWPSCTAPHTHTQVKIRKGGFHDTSFNSFITWPKPKMILNMLFQTYDIDIDLIRLGGLIGPICRSITSVLDSCLVKKHAGTLLPQMLYYVRAFHLLNRCSAIYVLVPVLV